MTNGAETDETNTKATSRRSSSVFLFTDDSDLKSPSSVATTGIIYEPKHLVVDLDGNNNNLSSTAATSSSLLRLERNEDSIIDLDKFRSFVDQSNATASGYCVDSIEPKCSELKRLIDEFKFGYLNKLNRFKSNKLILQRLNTVLNNFFFS